VRVKESQSNEFRAALRAWFAQSQRDLPWRRSRDPYRIWISEIMLQQTRVATVIPYYRKFLERFPTVHELAAAPEEEVLRMWSGLGYYRRAQNLQIAARQIVAGYGGEFPRKKAEVLELAGIGEYTAAAILSIAFGEKLAVLDGNVARVLARLDARRGDLRGAGRWRSLQDRADQLLDGEAAGDWNQAMMELGATLCTPGAPQCLLCPVRQFCEARKQGIAEQLPEKRRKRAEVAVRLAAAVLVDKSGNSLLLPPPPSSEPRPPDDHVPALVAKLWHFPTAPANGDGIRALRQLFAKQLNMTRDKVVFEALSTVRHTVTYRRIEVLPFLVRVSKLPPAGGSKTIGLNAVLEQPISNLTRKVTRVALAKVAADSSLSGG
jgi:A/G-specific adenine glycosylase